MRFLNSPSWRVFAIVFAVALLWVGYNNQIWEDFYITYRASKNLAEGHGLTFTEGERVHSFTSPLGVLLPAGTCLLTGRSSDTAALWIFRFICMGALGAAAVLLWRALRASFSFAAPAALLVALLATDSKIVCFTVNGMETALLLLFVAWALWTIFMRPTRTGIHLGLAWAGMMWTRPDSCVYIAVMALGLLLFSPGGGPFWPARYRWARHLALAAAVCTAVYLPWFAWAWSYYGSPVPHTITAKGLFNEMSAARLGDALRGFPQAVLAGTSTMRATFLPYYGVPPDWPRLVPTLGLIAGMLPLPVFLLPFVRPEARVTSLLYASGHLYLTGIVGFPVPWYLPLVALFGIVTLALCFGDVLRLSQWLRDGRGRSRAATALRCFAWGAAGGFLLGAGALTVIMARQAFVEMRVIEYPVRQAVGLWLREHARSPRDTVFLEPLGFIGFFSGLKMLDYPGLASPEVVAARQRATSRAYPYCWSEIIRDLQPDWLVLRPFERDEILQRDRLVMDSLYELQTTFDASAEIAATRLVPIRGFLGYNSHFSIYRLRDETRGRPRAGTAGVVPVTVDTLTRKEALAGVAQSGDVISAHAPAVLAAAVPPGAELLTGKFGIFAGAYANPPPGGTDGAGFRVELVAPDSNRTVLLQRQLDPVANPADRGSQPFVIELPAGASGGVEFIISTGAGGGYDWTYWESLQFEATGRHRHK